MKLRSLALSAFSLLGSLPLLAQDDPTATSGTPARGAPAANVSYPIPVFVTLSFQGGSLADFVAAIRKAEPKANILGAAGASSAVLPAMEIRGAGLTQVLEGACAVASGPMQVRMKEFRGPGESVFSIVAGLPSGSPTSGGKPSGIDTVTMPMKSDRNDVSEVHSLNRLLDPKDGSGFAVTTVLSAIETAVGGEGQLTTLKFHKESGLLIVRGAPDQIQLVQAVLASLERDVVDRRKQELARKAASGPGKVEAK